MDETPASWTATRLAAELADRRVASRELLEMFLARVERLNPALNAVVTLDVERARADAAAADREAAGGRLRGPLHGLPVTIKDAIEVAGVRSTGGAVELTDHVPVADAPAVARLRRAGAIVFGKTNVPRWSGDFQTFNEIFGTTGNPWDPSRTPGGSSGGAAAAVACGLTSFEVGTDIGGSVRIPSHCCGVFGLKPTFGVIPQRGYLDSVGGGTTDADINVFGPIARGAEDLELLLGVLAGPPPDQEAGWRIDLPAPRTAEASAWRVGVWFEEEGVPLQAEVLGALRRAADRLADAGARVSEARPPVEFSEQVDLFRRLIVAAILPSMDRPTAEAISPSHLSWLEDDRRRAELRAVWRSWFDSFDVLLCPALPVVAFPHQQEPEMFDRVLDVDGRTMPYIDAISWMGLIGVLGLPAAVAPVGPAGGLPVGIQVVTPWHRDRDAIRMAGLVAELAGGYRPPPEPGR